MTVALPVGLGSICVPEVLIRRLLDWYQQHRRELPWRQDSDPYRVWLSEVMLQQTRVEAALPYYQRFLQRYPRLEDLAVADEDEVLRLWSGLGYYSRARNLKRAAEIICDRHEGEFPQDLQQALALPGIGRYTAGAILSIAYGQAVPILDGNIRRLMARLLAFRDPVAKLDRRLWPLLSELVTHPLASGNISDFNQSLMELGALICSPRKPDCVNCPLRSICRAYKTGIQEELPVRSEKRATEELAFSVAVIEQGGRWLFRQGHGDGFLEGFWELPRVEGAPRTSTTTTFQRRLGLKIELLGEFPAVRHQITYRKIQFHPLAARLTQCGDLRNWRWARLEETDLPVASYTKKILRRVRENHCQRTFRYNPEDDF